MEKKSNASSPVILLLSVFFIFTESIRIFTGEKEPYYTEDMQLIDVYKRQMGSRITFRTAPVMSTHMVVLAAPSLDMILFIVTLNTLKIEEAI